MKTTLIDWVRKWGVGVRLLLWCWVTYVVMAMPAMFLLLLVHVGVPTPVLKILLGAYAILCVPLLAYRFGREFGLRYDKIPERKT